MMVLLLAASVVTQANAPDMHAFYNPATLKRAKAGQLSDAEQREAFRALFSHTNEAKWWNDIATCSFDQMRYIYALHLKDVFGAPQVPSSEEMLALVNRSQLVPAPATVHTAGIVIGTATVKRFSRPAYLNEKMFMADGIAWASGGCGNLGGNIFGQPDPLPIQEEFDRGTPDPRLQLVSDRRGDVDVRLNVSTGLDPNIVALIAAMQQRPEPAPAPASNNDGWMKEYMQMQMMKEMSQQTQPLIETRQRANFWEVAAGIGAFVNAGLGTAHLLQGAKTNRLLQSQMWRQNQTTMHMPTPGFPTWSGNNQQPQYGRNWNRPRNPQRPNYDTGTWYDQRNPPLPDTDYQGGSGNYVIGNGWGYQNANAGLGVGSGYDYGYGNSRSNPLNDNGNGRAVDTRNGRVYTYDRSW